MIGLDMDGVYGAGFRPDTNDFIIVTGRNIGEYLKTVEECHPHPVYCRPFGHTGDCYAAGSWKAYIINIAGLTDFYEDNDIQANIIKTNCLNCKVHKVSNGKYLGLW